MVVPVVAVVLVVAVGCTPTERRCDGAALAAGAAALRGDSQTLDVTTVDATTRTRTAAAVIWQACPHLPGALRVIVDGTILHHSRDELPELAGHADLHRSMAPYWGERAPFDRAVCPDFANVRIAEVPASERGAVAYDECDFGRLGFLTREEVTPNGHPDVVGLFSVDHWLTHTGGAAPEDAHTLVRALNTDWPESP